MNPDEQPFSPEATALRQGVEARVPEQEAARADERSSRNLIGALRDERDRFAQLVAAALTESDPAMARDTPSNHRAPETVTELGGHSANVKE